MNKIILSLITSIYCVTIFSAQVEMAKPSKQLYPEVEEIADREEAKIAIDPAILQRIQNVYGEYKLAQEQLANLSNQISVLEAQISELDKNIEAGNSRKWDNLKTVIRKNGPTSLTRGSVALLSAALFAVNPHIWCCKVHRWALKGAAGLTAGIFTITALNQLKNIGFGVIEYFKTIENPEKLKLQKDLVDLKNTKNELDAKINNFKQMLQIKD